MFASGNVDVSPSGYVVASKPLLLGYLPTPEEVNIDAIEQALSFSNRSWKFLVDLVRQLKLYTITNPWRFLHL